MNDQGIDGNFIMRFRVSVGVDSPPVEDVLKGVFIFVPVLSNVVSLRWDLTVLVLVLVRSDTRGVSI